eukprot:TRINITY_DN15059_c0_g1_i1.p1 TRINITY_DN15059_c0_g1~~TRINITY_DN15059_c0_g1_i1.p1  ORF type:complete len:191 (+),score=33.86 TRINITY_DN15059_c0_g1_i1:47-619(+)
MAGKNVFVLLPALLIMRQIDFNNTDNVVILRYVFGVVQALIIVAALYVLKQIRGTADQTRIQVPVQQTFEKTEPEIEFTTVEDYDTTQWRQLLMKIVMGMGISYFIHVKFGVNPPLFMQCIFHPLQLYNSQLFQIYCAGKPAVGSLLRPWKEEKPFESLMGAAAQKTAEGTVRDEKRKAKKAEKKAKKIA